MTSAARPKPLPRRTTSAPAPARPTGLLGLQAMPADEIRSYLLAARALAAATNVKPVLAGCTVANLFFEDSTRTRTSFTVAARNLGANVIEIAGSSSSVNKGESLIDTARNIEAMGVRALVVRAKQAGAAAMIARAVSRPVINAGDGRHEHPTQGLLDIYTIAEAHARLKTFDLRGLTIAIVGDVAASRVARSDIAGLTTLGARIICVGPPSMVPPSTTTLGVTIDRNLDRVLPAVDAVIMLRIQFERTPEGQTAQGQALVAKAPGIASVREYREQYGLSLERTSLMKPGAVVLHPGPINRGIELDASVADGPRSLILRQVANGVLIRMAALARVCQ